MRQAMRAAAALFLMAALGACVPPAQQEPAPQDPTVPPPSGLEDACGASRLQGLVGQPEAVLETLRFTQTLRVIHPGTAVTMDYSPFRLNILIADTGLIDRISCG